MKGMRFTAREKLKALRMWLKDKVDILLVCKRNKCSFMSLYRWKNMYDGTLESLKNKSSRPHTPHPNSHTAEEREEIITLLQENPDMAYNEIFGMMRAQFAYKRTYGGFYNFIVRNNLRHGEQINNDDYVPQPYDTPEMIGTKAQIDVKFVPVECYKGEMIQYDDDKYYQYTWIDEATRERFIYPYKEHNVSSTIDFVKRSITYFGYIPSIIQTDNGLEFTNHKEKHYKDGKIIETRKKHALDELCESLGIKHQLIRAYTPRLNGKVERSHRSDQESFYKHLEFKTYHELKEKMCNWLIRYNNRPHASLTNREGKHVYLTPIQKRADLLNLLKEKQDEFEKVRFLKTGQRSPQELYNLV